MLSELHLKGCRMKAKFLVSFIGLSILVFLLCSTAAQATEYREINKEVNAGDILKHIEKGEDINLVNCSIVGELNLSSNKFKTILNPAYTESLNEWFSEAEAEPENISVVESNIKIKRSIFKNDVKFSLAEFNGYVDFSGTNFNAPVSFSGTNFNAPVNFSGTNFNGLAYFDFATFNGPANFGMAPLTDSPDISHSSIHILVNFSGKNEVVVGSYFNDYADFDSSTFNAPVDFKYVIFNNSADFQFATFNNSAGFSDSTFNNSADFQFATFNNSADFKFATFCNSADFSASTFNNFAYFKFATFNSSADFQGPYEFKKIITNDGVNCNLFRVYYKNNARFTDANNIYYEYRKEVLAEEGLDSPSNLFDLLSFFICGFGLRPQFTLGFGVFLIGFFSVIYRYGPKISFGNSEKLISSVFDANIIFDGNLVKWKYRAIPDIPRFIWQGPIIYRSRDAVENNLTVTYWDALYFSIVRFTNVGSAEWDTKDRIWATVEGLAGWIMLGIFMATLVNVMMNLNF
jgi:Pentapeptide repeats (9 copies)/Ion channel